MADQKIAYASSASFTCTLASLASDTNLLAGRESTAVDNSSNLYLDYLITGTFTVASSGLSSSESINVYLYARETDSTWPEDVTGSDAALTWDSTETRDAGMVLLASVATNNTASQTYSMAPVSVAACFGGVVPAGFGLWVVQNTGGALASGTLSYKPIYATVS